MATYYETHREQCLERGRERREWYKAHGICIQCGHEEAVPGRLMCGECLYERNAHWWTVHTTEENTIYRRELYARYRAEGKCVECGRPAVEGRCMCQSCREKHNRAGRRWRREHRVSKDPGLCKVRECQEPKTEGRCWCAQHLAMYQEIMRKNRAKGNQDHPWRKDEQVRQKTEKWRRNAK